MNPYELCGGPRFPSMAFLLNESNHFLKYLFTWLHWVIVVARGLPLVVALMGYSLVADCGLLIVVASIVVVKPLL